MTELPPVKHSAVAAAAADDDPLGHLYKMSRTAGLGSSDYVAVNPLAVTAIIMGLLSGLVLMNAIFLILPLAAIVMGIVALRQIRNSNGTQTGRPLAWIGIVLALACTTVQLTMQVAQATAVRNDEREISALVEALAQDLRNKQDDAAYARLSKRFADVVKPELFKSRFATMRESPAYGAIKEMKWNERAAFDVDVSSGQPNAVTIALVDLENGSRDRWEMRFFKDGGQWKIDGIPFIFPPEVKLVGGPGAGGRPSQ